MGNLAQLFGGSSEKTDRKQELDARDQLRNVFSYALPEGKAQEGSGASLSGQAGDYFGRLLKSGRSEVAQQAAPAINSQLSAADATKRREAAIGTGRTGGTAEADRMAAGDTEGKVANIINSTDQQNKAVAAQGAAAVGGDQMKQALGLLGLSGSQIDALLENTRKSRVDSADQRDRLYNGVASDVSGILNHDWSSGEGDQSIMSGLGSVLSSFFL